MKLPSTGRRRRTQVALRQPWTVVCCLRCDDGFVVVPDVWRDCSCRSVRAAGADARSKSLVVIEWDSRTRFALLEADTSQMDGLTEGSSVPMRCRLISPKEMHGPDDESADPADPAALVELVDNA